MYKIAYYSASSASNRNLIALSTALKKFIKNNGKIIDIRAKSKNGTVNKNEWLYFKKYVSSVDILMICLRGGKNSCPDFDKLIRILPKNSKVFIQPSCISELEIVRKYCNLKDEVWKIISQYLSYGGVDNFYNMILFLSNTFANSNYKFTKPKSLPYEGIYHPKYESTLTLEEYLQKKYDPGRPTIGIWFHRNHWINNNIDYVDKTIEEIERHGANAIAVFHNSRKDVDMESLSVKEDIEKFFVKDKKVIIHALINMTSFSTTVLDEKSKNVFDRLDIPVIKAILFFNKKEERENSFQQLNSMNTAISTDMLEFDANLVSVPVVFKNISFIDSLTGARITKYAAEKEYISKLVHLTLNLYLIHKKSCNYFPQLSFV